MKARTPMELPFHFGPGSDLFGLFHATGMPPRKAVLLCPPLGQDQIRCHRLYRQLAQALATDGIAALRFDYYGSGDSAGASDELDWQRCIDDTAMAADELRRRSGCERVIAFGARLGACIAVEAAASARLAGLIMWDPIVAGAAHVARLDAMQDALRQDVHHVAAFGQRCRCSMAGFCGERASAIGDRWLAFGPRASANLDPRFARIGTCPGLAGSAGC